MSNHTLAQAALRSRWFVASFSSAATVVVALTAGRWLTVIGSGVLTAVVLIAIAVILELCLPDYRRTGR